MEQPKRKKRIELQWPDKGKVPLLSESGEWTVVAPSDDLLLRPLRVVGGHGTGLVPSIVVSGDRLSALSSLQKAAKNRVKLVYADVPRLEGFDETRAFQGEAGRLFNTWLTLIQALVAGIKPVLTQDGVVVFQVGDLELPFVRLLLLEEFGRDNYIGSIVWQTHYSPKGGKETDEIAATHETLICYALNREALGRVALPVKPEGYSNPDDDPRGEWEARQKDAGRDTVRLQYNVPPYRWSLVKGRLPPGLWRVSPMSGVVWGKPTAAGTYRFEAQAEDQEGRKATQEFVLKVRGEESTPEPLPSGVWWMQSPPKKTQRGPRITSDPQLPKACVGADYSFVLEASGGTPYEGSPRPSRGWAFGEGTLVRAILEDRCYFGKKGTSIPEPKRYLRNLEDGVKYVNIMSWWNSENSARTQDATKHLKDLVAAGLIEDAVPTAKPELLLARLVDAFSREGDWLLELFGRSGDCSVVALKKRRNFIQLAGGSRLDAETLSKCTVPRLAAVIDGREYALAQQSEGEGATQTFIPYQGGGHYLLLDVGPTVATVDQRTGMPRLLLENYPDPKKLCEAILGAEGFVRVKGREGIDGLALDGKSAAIVLSPAEFLDNPRLAAIASTVPAGLERLHVYYFRSQDDLDASNLNRRVVLKRVPMDLAC